MQETDVVLNKLPPDAYASMRKFAEHVPRNVSMLMLTGWHVVAAELLLRAAGVCEVADEVLASYDGVHVSLEAMAELRARVAVIRNALRRQSTPPTGDSK